MGKLVVLFLTVSRLHSLYGSHFLYTIIPEFFKFSFHSHHWCKNISTLIISQFPVHCMSYTLLHEPVCGIDSYTSVEMSCSGEKFSWLD